MGSLVDQVGEKRADDAHDRRCLLALAYGVESEQHEEECHCSDGLEVGNLELTDHGAVW